MYIYTCIIHVSPLIPSCLFLSQVFTPTLQCGSAILNVTLRSITNCLEDIKKHSDEDETDEMKKLQEKLDVR